MPLDLTILYRGPLSSCNYDCSYCPFAKQSENAAELTADRHALERFVEWVAKRQADTISVFFTPWGEALVRRWYRDAIVRLTRLPQVRKVAIQTNLSCRLEWLDACDKLRLGLWCTFHPSQTTRSRFVEQCRELDRRGVTYSAGVVGLRESFDEIEALREELSPEVYVWINAFKDQPGYYAEDEIRRLECIDPLFRTNNTHHASLGRACRCGEAVISVDGDGNIRRCHFINRIIGNIYEPGFETCLSDRPCSKATCGCHIGYVHMDDLKLYDIYGDGVLERVPQNWKASAIARRNL